MPRRSKSVKEFQGQEPIEGQDPVEPTNEEPEIDERAILLVFDDHNVVEQFVSLIGATALEVSEPLHQGDEGVLEIPFKVQKSEVITRNRDRRDGGRSETVVVRKLKVDGDVKVARVQSQMLT